MKDLRDAVLWIVLIVAVFGGGAELSYRIYQRYAPLNEQVRRETYEQSRAFREGTVRDLENMQLEYARGGDAQKAAIKSVALHRLADVDPSLLTPELRDFRAELRSTP